MVLTCTHNLCFEQKLENNYNFSPESDRFSSREILQYISYSCLRTVMYFITVLTFDDVFNLI